MASEVGLPSPPAASFTCDIVPPCQKQDPGDTGSREQELGVTHLQQRECKLCLGPGGASPKPVQNLPHLLLYGFIQHLVQGRPDDFSLLPAEVDPGAAVDELLPLRGLKDILKIVQQVEAVQLLQDAHEKPPLGPLSDPLEPLFGRDDLPSQDTCFTLSAHGASTVSLLTKKIGGIPEPRVQAFHDPEMTRSFYPWPLSTPPNTRGTGEADGYPS